MQTPHSHSYQLTYAQHKVKGDGIRPEHLPHRRHNALHGEALGDAHGPHFHALAALDDLNRRVTDGASPQVLQRGNGVEGILSDVEACGYFGTYLSANVGEVML